MQQHNVDREATESNNETDQADSFVEQSRQPPVTLWQEFRYLIVHEKKWWLVPILMSMGLIAMAVFMSSQAALPFVYTLF